MDTEENKGVVRQYVDEVFNAGDFGVVGEIVDESIAYREAGRHIDGRDAFKRGLSAYLATFGTAASPLMIWFPRRTESPFGGPFVPPTQVR
jgi:hypothetical protein